MSVQLPDDLAARLDAGDADLARRALEALASQEYRAGRLAKPELRRLLGFETSGELDGFLKAHGIDRSVSVSELNDQLASLDRSGI